MYLTGTLVSSKATFFIITFKTSRVIRAHGVWFKCFAPRRVQLLPRVAYKEKQPITDVALETSGLFKYELKKQVDPMVLIKGGIQGN
ncbi:MAG: hypothetical protein ABI767_12270 [Rhodanobacter sp.]